MPDPIAPIKSAKIVSNPMHTPPEAAAIGIYLFSILTIETSRIPLRLISSSFNFLATSLAPSPLISIQYLANKPQHNKTKNTYLFSI